VSNTNYQVCAKIIDATRNDPGNGDARENAIIIMADLLAAIQGAILGITRHADDTYTIGANAVAILQAVVAKAEGGAA